MDLIVFLILLTVGYLAGTAAEKNHYRKIRLRERASRNFPVLNTKDISTIQGIRDSKLVIGHVVVSVDYFKRFLAGVKNLFGGQLNAYESLMDRGRREAILRMKQAAFSEGFHMVVNYKLQTASIGKVKANNNKIACIDLIAYGTALRLDAPPPVAEPVSSQKHALPRR